MERLAEILETLTNRHGVENGYNGETEEERSKKHCEFLCEHENAREGNLNEIDGYDCRICKNKGYTVVPNLYLGMYQEMQVTCICAKARKTIRALNRSGLADVVHDCTFEKYRAMEEWQKIVLTTAKKYLDDLANRESQCFFFGGQTGSGKTHICTAIAIELLKRGKEVTYMLWRDEVTKLKAKVNEPDYEKELHRYKSVEVLYIDDLFKTGKAVAQWTQRPTQADINLAFEIINSRVMQKKITIISSENTLTDIIDIDEAVAGRIKQSCGEFCLNIANDRNKNFRLRG